MWQENTVTILCACRTPCGKAQDGVNRSIGSRAEEMRRGGFVRGDFEEAGNTLECEKSWKDPTAVPAGMVSVLGATGELVLNRMYFTGRI